MMYFVYNCLLTATFFASLPLLPMLYFLGKRFHEGLGERFGFYDGAKIAAVVGARPLWIHAASVGEVRSAAHLARGLRNRQPSRKIVLTTFTATGNRIAREMGLADVVLFLPLDLMWIVRRALARIDPAVLIIVETEIWPNLLREAHRKGVPTLLLSGRLSERSLRRYSLFATFFRRVVGYFTAMGMQSQQDRNRIVKLGASASQVSILGSLKRAASDAGSMRHMIAQARSESGAKRRAAPWLVVGSSHRGEEEILIDVFISLKQRFPQFQMVLAPRHP